MSALRKLIAAWEAIPPGDHPVRTIQGWLLHTMAPAFQKAREDKPCELEVTDTGKCARHTDRPLQRVYCRTCQMLVHPATTGAVHQINYHLKDVHDGVAVPYPEPKSSSG